MIKNMVIWRIIGLQSEHAENEPFENCNLLCASVRRCRTLKFCLVRNVKLKIDPISGNLG